MPLARLFSFVNSAWGTVLAPVKFLRSVWKPMPGSAPADRRRFPTTNRGCCY